MSKTQFLAIVFWLVAILFKVKNLGADEHLSEIEAFFWAFNFVVSMAGYFGAVVLTLKSLNDHD